MGGAPGAPPSPDSKKSPTEPDPGTQYDGDVLRRELDIEKDDADTVEMIGEMIPCFEPPTGLPHQDFIASAPIFLQVQKSYPDGSKDVRVMFSLSNKSKLKLQDGKTEYKGEVKDIDNVHITKEELDRIKIGPMKSGGGGGGMGMGGGMGAPPGAPPGGMGMGGM